jgi:hypothetical protein
LESQHAIVYVENHDTYCPAKQNEPEITRRGMVTNKPMAYAFVLFSALSDAVTGSRSRITPQ